jgi:basic membrane lipoprotein Med (substrate-binding protein (PBP1-ABC) superfamily)
VKKLSILMVFALVIALAVPAMAASNLDVSGKVDFENTKLTDGGDSSSTADLELYLEKALEENITLYSEIDVGYAFADVDNNGSRYI